MQTNPARHAARGDEGKGRLMEELTGYRGIKALVEAAALAAVRAGVPKADAVAASMKYEVDLMNAYASAEKRRRFLAAYKEAGAASQVAATVVRERRDARGNAVGITPRHAQRLRQKYVNSKAT